MWVLPLPFSVFPVESVSNMINITWRTRGTNKKSDTQICTALIFILLFGMSCTFQSNLTRYVIMLSGSLQSLYLRSSVFHWGKIRTKCNKKGVSSFLRSLYMEGNDSIFAWNVCHCWCQVDKILAWIVSVQINVYNELINIRKWCVRLVIISNIEYYYSGFHYRGGVVRNFWEKNYVEFVFILIRILQRLISNCS